MKKHHYVYHSYEEWGREYIGIRSCDCLPEEDTKYFGSFKDKTFKPTEKTIMFVCETREEVMEVEIKLHNFFDVSVNPQFVNRAKQTSKGFDRAGVTLTEEHKRKQSEATSGVPKPEAWRQSISGKNHPQFGVPRTEEEKKKMSEAQSGEKSPNYGKIGALHHSSKAVKVIKPDGTQRHFGSGHEAARELGISQGNLCKYLKTGHVLTRGPFKGWRFVYDLTPVHQN